MNISQLVTNINSLLTAYSYYEKPNQPNIGGEVKQSELSYVIESGSVSSSDVDIVDVTVKFLLTSDKSKVNNVLPAENLNSKIQSLIYDLHKQRVSEVGVLSFQNFQMFSPESGKWRAVIEFLTQVEMIFEAGEIPERCIITPPTGEGLNSLKFNNEGDVDNTMYIPVVF